MISDPTLRSFPLRGAGQVRDGAGDEQNPLHESIDQLKDLQLYPFQAIELDKTVDDEDVANISVRINSEGVQLNQADFILTLMSVLWEKGRRELEEFSRAAKHSSSGAVSPYNHFIAPSPDQLLRTSIGLAFCRGRLQSVYQLLRGEEPGDWGSSIRSVGSNSSPRCRRPTTRDSVENDLEELGVTGHLGDRRDAHAGCRHVEAEGDEAAVLEDLGVASGDQQAATRDVGPARPDLGPLDPPRPVSLLRP